MAENKVERGAAEDASGAPVTPTDVEASRTPPSQPSQTTEDDGSEGESGGTGEGQPDAG